MLFRFRERAYLYGARAFGSRIGSQSQHHLFFSRLLASLASFPALSWDNPANIFVFSSDYSSSSCSSIKGYRKTSNVISLPPNWQSSLPRHLALSLDQSHRSSWPLLSKPFTLPYLTYIVTSPSLSAFPSALPILEFLPCPKAKTETSLSPLPPHSNYPVFLLLHS